MVDYNSDELEDQIEQFYELFEDIKYKITQEAPEWAQQWKTGGYIVETNILSMYPCLYDYLEDE